MILFLGQAVTVLAAKEFIDNEDPVIVVNCNQFIEWNATEFLEKCNEIPGLDGAILTFKNVHPRFSYVNVDEKSWVTQMEEKKTISEHASAGLFYMKHGKDLVQHLKIAVKNGKQIVDL